MGVSTVVAASMLGHTVQVNENNYTYDVASMDYKKKVMSEVWKKAEGRRNGCLPLTNSNHEKRNPRSTVIQYNQGLQLF